MTKSRDNNYLKAHRWIAKQCGKPSHCVRCGSTTESRYHWVSISGNNLEQVDDWIRLCAKCHWQYDLERGKHPLAEFCKNGHRLTDDNVYNRPGRKSRNCKECHNIANRKWIEKTK